VLSEPLELEPGEEVRALFHVVSAGREFFVPDSRIAQLATPPQSSSAPSAAGFQRVPAADLQVPLPGALHSRDLGG